MRKGYKERMVNAGRPGRIKEMFDAGYRPVIEDPDWIDLETGQAMLSIQSLGGGDIGILMEIPDEHKNVRDFGKQVMNDLYSEQRSAGLLNGGKALKDYVEGEIAHYLASHSVWFFVWFKTKRFYFRTIATVRVMFDKNSYVRKLN